ncbi:metallophosphoesterase family protein [Virgibacillus halodenitrificans]|uniref:DNA repair exonuclease n=1 Tax=Virgibacillus halodenitrificans TaxID=1482 RepID=A0AAC9NK42_VIRHA|nr:DNA repair exonuclease [Virgibacillus halodenitrificans]APC47425.1 DNA repair exonuclease [Virgibacillus halodenitrificans]MYL46234.1 DNA repair exonuclease [Virgibacillus halodenitrificans]
MVKQISFIHAADLHLDSPYKGLSYTPSAIFEQIRESTFHALEHLVDAAIRKQVDFVLITGDLFDNERQSLKAQVRLKRAFEKLEAYHINVYMSYGNHDYIKGNIHPVAYPSNVYIFPEERVSHFTYTKNDEELAAIYGFSYENRAVLQNKVSEYEIKDDTIPFHIGMLHGSIQNNTEHDHYAPFQLSELERRNFHYWALGHIHKRQILKEDPPVVYSGNTQGRHRKETGEKGCYHVILTENDVEMTFLPLQAIKFTSIMVDVDDCNDIFELEKKLQTKIEQISSDVPSLLELTLLSTNEIHKEWTRESLIDEVIELVNEPATVKHNWFYIYKYEMKINTPFNAMNSYTGDPFTEELVHQGENFPVKTSVGELYLQKKARRYLEVLSKEEEETIKQEALELVINELHRK